MTRYWMSVLLFGILLIGPMFCLEGISGTLSFNVRAPKVYMDIQQNIQPLGAGAKTEACTMPQPYRGNLIFRSRYEGSDSARDRINLQAERDYTEKTRPFTELQQFLARETDAVIKSGRDKGRIECILKTLVKWKDASTLLQVTENHNGKATRKWTLAAISANLLKINLLAEKYDAQTFAAVKIWVAKLADQVVRDYSNLPLKKINNHSYWAAWAVMTSAALLHRKDLFLWSEQMFSTAMSQVDDQGFLPNELRRKSRAYLYHNYALTPLVGIAAFLQANGQDPFLPGQGGLRRLAGVVLECIDNQKRFAEVTGVPQVPYDLHVHGRLSWLALYLSLDHCCSQQDREELLQICIESLPLKSSRMGGDLGFLYLGL